MTLNDLEWRNSPYFALFSPNSIALLAEYVTADIVCRLYRVAQKSKLLSQYNSLLFLSHPV